ncbi:secondary thiamine-phosphate synthase enzyme YjbQ [uncultured Oscillibacter sp.]|jgi:secondary thiamine-phosphate synthase enzyme|uniref:secondary thiamine-phosphate synthase enzyme YjbQ n=2 Tax=Oscillibacter TaxID=459786 RepID=UPI00258D6713|nr:secondary thiamine-phosphate synthase enzyme YjbQ [uncultured Oscillibacter sp.]
MSSLKQPAGLGMTGATTNNHLGERIVKMKIHNEKISCKTGVHHPTFVDVTEDVKRIAASTGMKDGLITVYSQHTTCSVIIQEPSRSNTYHDIPLIQQDLVNALAKIIPTCEYEGQYLHPDMSVRKEVLASGKGAFHLNTDAHLRSVIMGRSVSIPIINGEVQLGLFGHVYFVDWDQVRERDREVIVHIIGE